MAAEPRDHLDVLARRAYAPIVHEAERQVGQVVVTGYKSGVTKGLKRGLEMLKEYSPPDARWVKLLVEKLETEIRDSDGR